MHGPGLGGGLLFPSYRIIAAKLEPQKNQGKLQAALLSVGLCGLVLGALLFGNLVKISGIGSKNCETSGSGYKGLPFIGLTVVTAIGATAAMTYMVKTRGVSADGVAHGHDRPDAVTDAPTQSKAKSDLEDAAYAL